MSKVFFLFKVKVWGQRFLDFECDTIRISQCYVLIHTGCALMLQLIKNQAETR